MKIINGSSLNEAFGEQFWDLVADEIAFNGFAVLNNYISNEQAQFYRDYINEKSEQDKLKKAAIGKNLELQRNEAIRGDQILWIDKNGPHVEQFIQKQKGALIELNRRLFLGLKDFETHFTHYPSGTFYKRHSDRFSHGSHRVISFVCYLNQGWLPEDGGQLLIFKEEETHVIDPVECCIVFFRSELEHEVLPTYNDRYSITGWMLDQKEGLTFL